MLCSCSSFELLDDEVLFVVDAVDLLFELLLQIKVAQVCTQVKPPFLLIQR